jgi:membrane associated rhomboid family serine protease
MKNINAYWAKSGTGIRLIIVNVVVFVLIYVPLSVLHLMNQDATGNFILNQLVLPGNLLQLLFKPWTLVTHLFVHYDVLHILFNMITLYFGYQLFTTYLDNRKYLNVYFVSGFSGAIVYLISVNVFPLFDGLTLNSSAAGASAATLGALIAICAFQPDGHVNLFGVVRVQLRWLAIIFVLLDLINLRNGNEGGHLAHLGGALFGFIWGIRLHSGQDLASFLNPVWLLFSGKRESSKKSKLKVTHRQKITRSSDLSPSEKQKQIDIILDKISRSGYDSLSKEEKSILFELSKEK